MADYIDKVKLPSSTVEYQFRDIEAFGLRGYTALASSADLNNTTAMGNYYAIDSSTAKSLVNRPPDPNLHYGQLKVGYTDISPSYFYQWYFDGVTGQEWYRINANGSWTSW